MEFSVKNINVYGLENAIRSSGWPKSVTEPDVNEGRALKLGNATPGSGHDCFLKGIVFQADITASHAFWIQWSRYHFCDIVSSQSKMHKITEMDLSLQCSPYVDKTIIDHCNMLVQKYIGLRSPESFEQMIMNLPMGLMLTASITDNYLSLKTQYIQRKTDKLQEWEEYLLVMQELPMFRHLCLSKNHG